MTPHRVWSMTDWGSQPWGGGGRGPERRGRRYNVGTNSRMEERGVRVVRQTEKRSRRRKQTTNDSLGNILYIHTVIIVQYLKVRVQNPYEQGSILPHRNNLVSTGPILSPGME